MAKFFGKDFRKEHNDKAGDVRKVILESKEGRSGGSNEGEKRRGFKKFIVFIIVVVFVVTSSAVIYGNWDVVYQVYIEGKGDVLGEIGGWFDFFKDRVMGAGDVWSTETIETEDKGIIFEDFIAVTPAVPAGEVAVLAYDFSVYEGAEMEKIEDVPLVLICNPKQKNLYEEIWTSDFEENDGEREFKVQKVSSDNPSSYMNKYCSIKTKQVDEETKMEVEGAANFSYETKNVVLSVYFLKGEFYNEHGKDFFDFYNIDESLPIKSGYKGEPVSVGIGTSLKKGDLYAQPVPTGEKSINFVGITLRNEWQGFVSKVESLTLQLPEGVELDDKKPSLVCPFDADGKTMRRGYNVYESVPIKFKGMEFGTGKENNFHNFNCKIRIDEDSLLGDSPYVKKSYIADVEYTYEFAPKTSVVTLLDLEGELTDEGGTIFEEEDGEGNVVSDESNGLNEDLSNEEKEFSQDGTGD